MAPATPQEDRLKRLLTAKEEQIKTARDTWNDTLTQVRRSHHEITQGVPNLIKGLNSEAGRSVREAFTEMGSALDVRRGELKDARDALDAVLVDLSISNFLYQMAGPPPTKATVDPLPADADTDAKVKHDADKQTAQNNYENDVADRERYCKWLADGLEQTYGNSADVLKRVHGEPTPHPADNSERPPQVPPLAIPTGGGNTGTPHVTPGVIYCPPPEQGPIEVEYPICEFGPHLPPQLPEQPPVTVTEVTPVSHTPHNPTVITTGTTPGIGTIGMAGAGALAGGALIRAALRSIGVTPAGSTPTTRQVGLGRPGANGRAAGVGSPTRAAGAAGAGAAGRGGRGAAGGRGGMAGAGTRGGVAGGSRGAAGGRGAGAGVGAGGRGKGKGKGTAANPDIFEAEHDWYENEGQPGILD